MYNKCLEGINRVVRVANCVDRPTQHWTHRNFAIVNGYSGFCLEPFGLEPEKPQTVPCRTSSYQGWNVTYW